MKKKMKVPKNTNEKFLSNDVEAMLIGIMLLLVSLIGLLGKGPVGQFLQYCVVFVFGNFYFLVYAYLFFFSVYLIATKKMFVMKINLYLFAAILILFSFLIGASDTSVELTIGNFTGAYLNVMNATPGISLFRIESFEAISYTGGGYLGYMLRGFLNTCFTSVGTSITIGIFAFAGLSVFLKDIVIYFIRFFRFVKTKYRDQNAKKAAKQEEIRLEEKKEETRREEKIPGAEIVSDDLPMNEPETVVEEKPKMDFFAKDIEEVPTPDFAPSEKKEAKKPLFEEISPIESVVAQPIRPTIEEPFSPREEPSPVEKAPEAPFVHEEKRPKYESYQLPPISLLSQPQNDDVSLENRIIAENRLEKINELFRQFKIGASAISYTIGPSCTRFNIKMNPGVKVNVLSSIQNEIAINLGGNKTVRLELVVEGRDTSSIEIGNAKIASVSFRECLEALNGKTSDKDKLLVPLGKGIEGNVVTVSLDELPHLLVAGTTGSGKSVFINTVIATLIMRNRPDELKLMLIDPKKVEFSKYNDLPHLLCPVITEAVEGKNALKKLVEEMERRYSVFLTNGKGCSKISEYNELAEALGYEKMPNIVMICDEFSDFMSEYGKEIEPLIKRLAQKARACGIYLIICTQRPSVSVITGDIKAVVPSRIALLVPQVVDSRTILDEGGAESLLGNGDMLARIPRHSSLVRVQGSFIRNLEIIKICDFIKGQCQVEYDENFKNLVEQDDLGLSGGDSHRRERDPLHEQAKIHVIETRIASTSNLQSRFGIGYARADHILNCLEDEHVIKRSGNGNRRIVVMTMEEYQSQKTNGAPEEEEN